MITILAKTKLNSVVFVLYRTIPTERPTLLATLLKNVISAVSVVAHPYPFVIKISDPELHQILSVLRNSGFSSLTSCLCCRKPQFSPCLRFEARCVFALFSLFVRQRFGTFSSKLSLSPIKLSTVNTFEKCRYSCTHILSLDTTEASGQLYFPTALPAGKDTPVPLVRRLGGLLSRCGRHEEKNVWPIRELNPSFPVLHPYRTTVPVERFWLPSCRLVTRWGS
jgi:hypothetical protein